MWRLRARRRRGSRGAALVEMILITPILVMFAIGILEYGLAWRDSITISSTLRAGARVGSNAGHERLADYNTLLAVQAAVASIPNAQINKIVIFKSTDANGGVPANCLTTTAGGINGGVNGVQCNVYTGAQLASLSASSFGSTGSGASEACSGSALDRFWCPLGRETRQAVGTHYFGVWMQVTHPYVTRIFPGTGITIRDSAIMRIEPSL